MMKARRRYRWEDIEVGKAFPVKNKYGNDSDWWDGIIEKMTSKKKPLKRNEKL